MTIKKEPGLQDAIPNLAAFDEMEEGVKAARKEIIGILHKLRDKTLSEVDRAYWNDLLSKSEKRLRTLNEMVGELTDTAYKMIDEYRRENPS